MEKILKKLRRNPKKVVFAVFILLVFYVSNKFFELAFYYGNGDILKGFFYALLSSNYLFSTLSLSLEPLVFLSSFIPVMLVIAYINHRKNNKKNFKKNIEYGSSKFGSYNDISDLVDNKFSKNLILSKSERITLFKAKHPKYERNKNVLVIGGSGSGKTRFIIKPNLMQLHSSFVVTDPKGTILNEVGNLLSKNSVTYLSDGKYKTYKNSKGKEIVVKEPYKIKVLNTINFNKSNKYNPFVYIKDEKDILKFVETLIANTTGENAKASEDFWVKAEKLLYTALISYIKTFCPKEEQNMSTLIDLLDDIDVDEDNPDSLSVTDIIFDILENGDDELKLDANPTLFCVRQYKKYKKAAGKTAKSILISCGARLAPFDIQQLRELMSEDELELDKLGDEKTALFVINSDTDMTFNFINALMYSQLFNILCTKADDEYNGKLPIHVRCLIDEFANIGKIPDFDKLIATIRSRNISAMIILQAKSQLKTMYKDASETIIGNCDSEIFLGGKEGSTLKDISEALGKETIDLINSSNSYGNQRSMSRQEQKLGRNLMDISELKTLPRDECIVQVSGINPFKSKKYDITQHKNYKHLFDGDKSVDNFYNYAEKLRLGKNNSNDIAKANTSEQKNIDKNFKGENSKNLSLIQD